MSKITYAQNCIISGHLYKELLEKKIKDICSKIAFNDSGVTWIIYDSINMESSTFGLHLAKKQENPFGYCNTFEKKIYISNHSLNSDFFNSPFKASSALVDRKQKDLLANVIIDEITHLQTGYDHGHPKYEQQLSENHRKYYYGSTSAFLLYQTATPKFLSLI